MRRAPRAVRRGLALDPPANFPRCCTPCALRYVVGTRIPDATDVDVPQKLSRVPHRKDSNAALASKSAAEKTAVTTSAVRPSGRRREITTAWKSKLPWTTIACGQHGVNDNSCVFDLSSKVRNSTIACRGRVQVQARVGETDGALKKVGWQG